MVGESRWSLLLQWIFFGFAFWFICIVNRDYLFLLHEYTLFLGSFPFLIAHLTYVGGPLDYVGYFLAQFFLWPYLGGSILVILLILVRQQTESLFHLKGNGLILSFVPSALLIWFFTRTGYAVFVNILVNSLLVAFIGVLLALSFAVWYSRIVSPFRRNIFCSLGTILLYYLAGIYGLLGTLLCLLHECSRPRSNRHLAYCMLPLLCGLLTPFLLFWLQLTKTNLVGAYFVGIPPETAHENYVFFFYPTHFEFYVLLACLLALAFLRLIWKPELKNKINRRFAAMNAILLLLTCCAISVSSHTRGDLLITAKMCRLLCDENWEGILQVQYENENPSMPIQVFRQLALFKLDRIADEVFTYPTTMPFGETQSKWFWTRSMFADHVLFEYGLVNMAFRTAMNQYGQKSNISNLRILALAAMANEEYEVAQKHLRLIKQSPFYRDWAQNHIDYIESRRLPVQAESIPISLTVKTIDRRLNNIRILMPVVNELEFPHGNINDVILRGFLRKNIEGSPSEVRKMFLVQLLLKQDLVYFRKYYDLWADELYADRIPRHFQEALIIDVTYEDIAARAAHYGISPDLAQKCAAFMKTVELAAQSDHPVDSSLIYQEFGSTFWFYLLSD